MTYAIIDIGGKQYLVEEGDSVLVDRVGEDAGNRILDAPGLQHAPTLPGGCDALAGTGAVDPGEQARVRSSEQALDGGAR